MLLDYAEHQRRLLPLLAETYAAGFAHEHLLAAFDDVFSGRNDTPETARTSRRSPRRSSRRRPGTR